MSAWLGIQSLLLKIAFVKYIILLVYPVRQIDKLRRASAPSQTTPIHTTTNEHVKRSSTHEATHKRANKRARLDVQDLHNCHVVRDALKKLGQKDTQLH